ncbi:MAG: hypothetical protein V4510_08020 [bacterium]
MTRAKTPRIPAAPAASPENPAADLHTLFEVWVDSELKAQVVIFYNNNPGVIETAEGLARRLGTNVEALRDAVADHVRLGLLQARTMGDKTVLLFNRERRGEIQELVMAKLRRRMGDPA